MTSSLTRTSAAALLFLGVLAGPAVAQMPPSPVNLDENGVILRGYDVVAYHTQQAAVPGSPQFTATHEGAIFRFASRENRDAFHASPARFAPKYGGYCAMGVALGKKLDVDPEAFRVVDGKLYLNLNRDVQKEWLKDVPGNVVKAERNWSKVKTLPLS